MIMDFEDRKNPYRTLCSAMPFPKQRDQEEESCSMWEQQNILYQHHPHRKNIFNAQIGSVAGLATDSKSFYWFYYRQTVSQNPYIEPEPTSIRKLHILTYIFYILKSMQLIHKMYLIKKQAANEKLHLKLQFRLQVFMWSINRVILEHFQKNLQKYFQIILHYF